MTKPEFYVDFNEMLDRDLVLLSATHTKVASDGTIVLLHAGMEVSIFMDDVDEHGRPDNLVAAGVVEANAKTGWAEHVQWCCRINADGIRHQSELNE